MKYFSICLFVAIAIFSCDSKGPQSCNCVQQGWGSLKLILPLTQNSVPLGSTFTINQTHLAGSFIIDGAVHPNMSINTGQWASEIVYKINLVERFRQTYQNGLTWPKTYPILGNLQLGANTITVEAVCTQLPSVFCPIATFTINLTTIEGNVTLQEECCDRSVKLLMAGNFTGSSSVPGEVITGKLKVEKEIGSNNWVQEGALIPFLNNGFTTCYPRPTQMTTQRYRATLLDLAGNPMPNNLSGTAFPKIFGICRECCPPKE